MNYEQAKSLFIEKGFEYEEVVTKANGRYSLIVKITSNTKTFKDCIGVMTSKITEESKKQFRHLAFENIDNYLAVLQ